MKIVLDHLTKRFPNRDRKKPDVIAVNDFCFEIPDGKLIGLLGPSGCGKSTALNLISGLETPTAGKVFFGEDDVTDLPPEHRGVGLVFQNYALYPHLTVMQNITFPLENLKGEQKLTRQEMEAKAKEIAGLVQIGELMERKPAELSGGQQQRVAIARALVKKPRVLLLDEPLSNLDARLRLQTREEIRRIQRETGITTVFVTHDQEEAMSISDQIILMKDGVLHQIGSPQEVYDRPADLFVAKFLGTPQIAVFQAMVKDEKLMIGEETVMNVPGISDRPVTAAVRPEGFVPSENAALGCSLCAVEIMGRDTSIVAAHPAATEPRFRAIIPSDTETDRSETRIRFDLKPEKVHLFDQKTEERIEVSGSAAE